MSCLPRDSNILKVLGLEGICVRVWNRVKGLMPYFYTTTYHLSLYILSLATNAILRYFFTLLVCLLPKMQVKTNTAYLFIHFKVVPIKQCGLDGDSQENVNDITGFYQQLLYLH